ncbi:hypothetical protein BCR41DRAFT_368780 [Lobosporangium transversale]|uniref:Uncharacterized protein n=1 Tax=Lobosporangium transversale TaxID=64571 RepID=A0A1Y2GWJ8_9FUNG|nr:hypothetical protein BCR41DRAFT_368780 [Lobosporangium transversale]ORZ24978.1 hypothetical protein BCR41DRAFT_368780 [Lobosporangium transversale]|eukprot:XP_021883959.1 hypothetical protein BCR41DRAFT_368780 [Lobosporangium transversale]
MATKCLSDMATKDQNHYISPRLYLLHNIGYIDHALLEGILFFLIIGARFCPMVLLNINREHCFGKMKIGSRIGPDYGLKWNLTKLLERSHLWMQFSFLTIASRSGSSSCVLHVRALRKEKES